MDFDPSSIAGIEFPSLIVDNGGIVFGAMFLIMLMIVSVKSGIKSGLILYLITGIASVLLVTIGALSSSFLIYLTLPIILLIVIKVVMGKGGEE